MSLATNTLGDVPRRPKTALVLSGGGMFGAYQAGVWSVLAEFWQPDIVVGASVGSLNGWAIAGGASGDDLHQSWLDPRRAERHRYRLPRSIHDGFIDPSSLEKWIQELHAQWTPRCQVGVALTEMWSFRLQLVQNSGVTWRHLAASCGVPLVLPSYVLDGRRYVDGGLVTALPLWGALAMGAERIVSVNLLAGRANPLMSASARALRWLTGFKVQVPPDAHLVQINPRPALGRPPEMIYWDRGRVEAWFDRGRHDGLAKKHFVCDMF